MSLGAVMLDVAGPQLSAEERERLAHPQVGGVILFTRNYESPAQLAALVESVHALRRPPLLVAVDQEGGRVQRFRDGFTRLPAMARIGRQWHDDALAAQRLARELGWLMAAELRCVGIDLSFAPVADLDSGLSGVVGDRAFHADPAAVAALAEAWFEGMREAGLSACAKHFPGHGSVAGDSHLEHPSDTHTWAHIQGHDLRPFRHLVQSGIPAVMPAHVVYPKIDRQPAGYSRHWLGEVLRRELGFQGAIFSDDLSMAAADVAGDPVSRAQRALAAGCDVVICCNHPRHADQILHALTARAHSDPVAQSRLARLHGRSRFHWQALKHSQRWRDGRRLAAELTEDYDNEFNV